jgi:hypothetical protein
MRVTTIRLCLLAALLFALSACSNGSTQPGPGPFDGITSVSFSDTTPTAGDDVTLTVHFIGTQGPYTFTFTFGDGVTPAVQQVTVPSGPSTASLTVTLDSFTTVDNPDGQDVSVSVTSQSASGGVFGPVSGTFHVTGIAASPPTIDATYNPFDRTVAVAVAAAAGADLTVTALSQTPALRVVQQSQLVAGGSGVAVFDVEPTNVIAGGSGQLEFSVSANGLVETHHISVSIQGLHFKADALYAIPLQTEVQIGEPVTIQVSTGKMSHPFQYMTGVRVCAPAASGYDAVGYAASMNMGSAGGAPDDADGIWDEMGIKDGDFLLWPDFYEGPVDAGNGLLALDLNVTPLGGHDMLGASGDLINFQASFTTPGTWKLSFQQTNIVNRTYYQDGNQAPDYFWGDITNDHPGVPNSVTVVP